MNKIEPVIAYQDGYGGIHDSKEKAMSVRRLRSLNNLYNKIRQEQGGTSNIPMFVINNWIQIKEVMESAEI